MKPQKEMRETVDKKFDMQKHFDKLCTDMIIALISNDEEVHGYTLNEIFENAFGPSWKRVLKWKVKKVRKKVAKDVEEGRVDPKGDSDHPFRFIANSIVIHAIELAVSKSDLYEGLDDVRRDKLHVRLNDALTSFHEDRLEEE